MKIKPVSSLPSPVLKPAAVAIFARTPVPGYAKTRLIPLLGKAGAARMQSALLADTLRKARSLRDVADVSLFLAGRNSGTGEMPDLSPRIRVHRQRGASLGKRLEAAFRKLFRHYSRVVVIGTDSPLLPPNVLRLALRELSVCDGVLGPCPDGGYCLIGLSAARSSLRLRGLLSDVRWSTRFAFRDTLQSLTASGLSISILEMREDIDRPADVMRLQRSMNRHPASRHIAPATWSFLRALP